MRASVKPEARPATPEAALRDAATARLLPLAIATGDKREAILAAAERCIARLGLHNTPMTAVAREAGVAAGTIYLYFAGKEAMINALYLEVLADRRRAIDAGARRAASAGEGRDAVWETWQRLARWYLDRPTGASVLVQCQAGGILTAETREIEQAMEVEHLARFEEAQVDGVLRRMPRQVFWAHFVGPIVVLAQMRDTGEIAVTREVLRVTFEGVWRSVMAG